ncbi:uncharacterized protein LOC128829625 isoform X2 [Malaclemys terrapin pileata]|uniref:uncharacterized protein LOC128829625 isoform X2 n=1 Tax=Malaclemys terrapin pileata TaxID=2991368 RepID=UPI0023A8B963|nr:uncharacterized protein LOC128829625 isoform X2 [Malaclemys terrapin pileata]
MATLWGWRAGTMGLGGLLIPLLFLGVADSQLVLSVGPSPVRAALGSDVQLPCTFTVMERFEITKFYLAWSLGGHRVAEYIREQKIYQQGSELFPEELSRGNCSLRLRQVAVRDGGRYTSTVIYTPDKEEKQLELQVTAAPRLSIPRKAGVLNAATSFPCHVWGFYPQDVTVTWLRDGRVLTDATRSAPQRNPDGTFNLTLTHTFTPTANDSGSIFSCHVSHAALAQPLREEFPLVIGAPPRISVPRRSAVRNTETYFPCHVWGFYPGDVTVTWLRDGRVLTDATRSAPQRNPDGTFNLTAVYIFTPIESDSGSIFSCRVSHAALAQPLREEFPLAVTEAHGSTTVLTAVLGISVTLAAVTTALATYFWCRWKGLCAPTSTGGKVPYSDSEVPDGKVSKSVSEVLVPGDAMEGTFPEDTAVTWERIHGQDRTLIGTDGVSEAGEGPEHQPLLHPQPQRWRATQERSGTCLMDNGARDSCSFHHEARGIQEQRESGEIRPWAQPQVSGIQVLPHWEPRDEVPFAVQIQNFYPSEIHRIQWSCDGKTWEKCEPIDSSQNPDLTFSATSVWRIPSHQITRPEFTVTVSVQQSPQSPAIEREIRAGDTDLLRPPEVSEISQPESVMAGEEITLSCCMTGHFPGALSVTWLRRGRGAGAAVPLQGSAEYRIELGAPRTQDGKSFQQETRLSFTPSVQRDQGAEYICQVGHCALQTPLERRSRELQVTDVLVPKTPVLGEISRPQVLAPGEQVTLSCFISRFYPKELRVTWHRRGRGEATFRCLDNPDTHKIVTLDPKAMPDRKSYSVTSQLRFTPVVPGDDGAEYRCSVEHQTLQEPEAKSTGPLELRVPQAPVLGEISRPQVLAPGEQVTLSCQISRFYPKELSVAWHRQKRGEMVFRCLDNLDTHKIDTPDPTAAADGKSYSVTSQLRFTPLVPEDDGAEYLCSVEHQTLQEPEGKSTGPLELRDQVELGRSREMERREPRNQPEHGSHVQRYECLENTPPGTEPSGAQSPSVRSANPSKPRDRERDQSQGHRSPAAPGGVRNLPTRVSDGGGGNHPELLHGGAFPRGSECDLAQEGRGARAAVPLKGSAEYRIDHGAPHTQDGKSFQQETRLSFTPSVQRYQGAEYDHRVGHDALWTPIEKCRGMRGTEPAGGSGIPGSKTPKEMWTKTSGFQDTQDHPQTHKPPPAKPVCTFPHPTPARGLAPAQVPRRSLCAGIPCLEAHVNTTHSVSELGAQSDLQVNPLTCVKSLTRMFESQIQQLHPPPIQPRQHSGPQRP